ncbi:hypothetical protein BJX68DRAFT_129884 [Aspergillus pseudodeflectus]|uniref:Uncharacterized protein n=1 Tax=Aspergillus pseudodeflectus TaxID=176178 RepID=A0ABR4K0F3_9EURO
MRPVGQVICPAIPAISGQTRVPDWHTTGSLLRLKRGEANPSSPRPSEQLNKHSSCGDSLQLIRHFLSPYSGSLLGTFFSSAWPCPSGHGMIVLFLLCSSDCMGTVLWLDLPVATGHRKQQLSLFQVKLTACSPSMRSPAFREPEIADSGHWVVGPMGEGVSGLPAVCWDWPSLVQRCMLETSQAS